MRSIFRRSGRVAPSSSLPGDEIRRRAVSGVGALAVRGFLLQLLAFVGSVVLARLLVPRDFGIVALGATIGMFATALASGGLGATLIRRREPPDAADLRALFGFQLVTTIALAAATAAIALQFGHVGHVTAVMAASLPMTALRTPALILLERDLSYRPLALVDVLETLAYYAWAISTVAAGWGVWGLASATLCRAVFGSALMMYLSPIGPLRPNLAWSRVRKLLSFGVRFQAVALTTMLRDQALNLGTIVIGGVGVLGLWSAASRILQIPYVIFNALWRVYFPAMSRLVAGGENPGPIVERAIGVAAVATGAILAPLAGSASALVPSLLGAKWTAASDPIPWACIGLMVSGPISVAVTGCLWAVGDARTPLRATALNATAWIAVAFSLLPRFGAAALGVGWLAASAVESAILSRAISRRADVQVARPLVAPALAAFLGGGLGWAITSAAGATIQSAAMGVVSAEALYLGLLLIVRRRLLADTLDLVRRAARTSVVARGEPA